MTTTRRLDVEVLYSELRRVLKHGARAARLRRHAPKLIDLVLPGDQHPELDVHGRAYEVEQIIRRCAKTIGGEPGEALLILLCLAPGTVGTPLEQRRREAAALFDMLPDTFRRPRHEGALLWDLVMEIYGMICQASSGA